MFIQSKMTKTLLMLGIGLTLNNAYAGVFKTYTEETGVVREYMFQPLPDDVAKTLESNTKSKDAVLYLLEKGRIEQTRGDTEASFATLQKALEEIKSQDQGALVSLSGIARKGLSLVSNDSVTKYQVPAYEKVCAYIFQAYNYLSVGKVEDAAVEIRNAQRIQREIELATQEKVAKAAEKGQKTEEENLSAAEQSRVDGAVSGLNTIASKVKNGYQNAYAYYMAATLWEATGEYNDAVVDYKKAYELQPKEFIAKDIKRADDKLSRKTLAGNSVVVLYEQGLMPQKAEHTMNFPVPNGMVNISYAAFNSQNYVSPTGANVSVDGVAKGKTEFVTDFGALGIRNLRDQLKVSLPTQILRSVSKYKLQSEVGNRLGILGQLAANVYNVASEHADLRSWNTLPSNAQVLRFNLPAGSHTLNLRSGNGAEDAVQFTLSGNETLFVRAVEVGGTMAASYFTVKVGQR